MLLMLACLGAARYQAAQPRLDQNSLAWYNDQEGPFTVEGVMIAPADERDYYTNLRVQVTQLHGPNTYLFKPARGVLLAKAPPGGDWRYGDRVYLEGALTTPPQDEAFSYRDYLAREGIYSLMPYAQAQRIGRGAGNLLWGALYAVKERALQTVYRIYPDPEASLLAGILLGVESGIPDNVSEAFRQTGTSHLIAISGFNISLIAGMLVTLFRRLLGPRKGAVAAGLGIAFYTLLVGADPPVVRAALLGGLSLLAAQVGRRQHGLNSLAVVAGLMALWEPQVLWSVGFQLSFTATLGLVLYTEPMQAAFERLAGRWLDKAWVKRLAGPVGEYFLMTLAAQIVALPVLAYHFRSISLISLVANPLVLPAQPPLMVFGGLALLAGLVWAPLGQALGYLSWPFVAYTIRMVELLARVPGGNLALGEVALPVVAAYYAALLTWTFGRERWPKLGGLLRPGVLLGLLGLLAVLAWRGVFTAPDGRLHLTLLAVSGGEAALIKLPDGQTILVNGGPSPRELGQALGRRLPLGQRRIDWLVVAGPGDEQIGALAETIERFPVGQVLWAGGTHGTRAARNLQTALLQAGIASTRAAAGQALDLGRGAELRVLTVNPRGAVLLLTYAKFRALLPIGLDFEDIETLQNGQAIGPVTALLLADAGYAATNPPQWLATLNPEVALLSIAPSQRAERPDAEVLEALAGYTLLRTDEQGWIELVTDGEQVWVETER
jgi:competence protein ComEC